MRGERAGHSLQATALVNEAYLRLFDVQHVNWRDRSHFMAMAARMMRRILVEFARAKIREKRGGGWVKVSLGEDLVTSEKGQDLVALDDALDALAQLDERKSRVVELRFFGGLSVEETAEALSVSAQTVMRDWKFSRAWLMSELERDGLTIQKKSFLILQPVRREAGRCLNIFGVSRRFIMKRCATTARRGQPSCITPAPPTTFSDWTLNACSTCPSRSTCFLTNRRCVSPRS